MGRRCRHVEASLEALLDTSLLQQREGVDGEVRVMMLETVRDYALEQLAASGELEQVQRRHADYFVMLAERAVPIVSGPRRRWWDRLEAEHDNLRAALAWSRTEASGEIGLRLAVALAGFWMPRGHFNEGYGWLAAAVTPREVDVSVGTVHQELSKTAGLCARLAWGICRLSRCSGWHSGVV